MELFTLILDTIILYLILALLILDSLFGWIRKRRIKRYSKSETDGYIIYQPRRPRWVIYVICIIALIIPFIAEKLPVILILDILFVVAALIYVLFPFCWSAQVVEKHIFKYKMFLHRTKTISFNDISDARYVRGSRRLVLYDGKKKMKLYGRLEGGGGVLADAIASRFPYASNIPMPERAYGALFGLCTGDSLGGYAEDNMQDDSFDAEIFKDMLRKESRDGILKCSDNTWLSVCLLDGCSKNMLISKKMEWHEEYKFLARIVPVVFIILSKKHMKKKWRYHAGNMVRIVASEGLRANISCFAYIATALNIADGNDILTAIRNAIEDTKNFYSGDEEYDEYLKGFAEIMDIDKIMELTECELITDGYIHEVLRTVFWCLLKTDGYIECILRAVSLSGDRRTIGAAVGALAGMYYGFYQMPSGWLWRICEIEEVESCCIRFWTSYDGKLPERIFITSRYIHKVFLEHFDVIEPSFKNTSMIEFTASDNILPSDSKFGGKPYLAEGYEYPIAADGRPYIFIAQINLSDIKDIEELPENGILQFFAEDDGCVSGNKGSLVRYIPDEHVRSEQELSGEKYEAAPLLNMCVKQMKMDFNNTRMTLTNTCMEFKRAFKDRKLNAEQKKYNNYAFGGFGSRVGGYPRFIGGDKRRDADRDVLLLQIDGNFDADNGILNEQHGLMSFFIDKDDLKHLDFSKAFCVYEIFSDKMVNYALRKN